MPQLRDLLKSHSVRLTAPRQAVFDTLQQATTPLQIGAILKNCPDTDRVSVYRTLDLFQNLGIVQALHMGFKKTYELAEPFKEHHHHIHCTQCHAITSIHSEALERTITQLATEHQYQLGAHHIELWGICSMCSAAATTVNQ